MMKVMTEGFHNFVGEILEDSQKSINPTNSCDYRHKERYHESKVSINKV